jgi:hypothetical protein
MMSRPTLGFKPSGWPSHGHFPRPHRFLALSLRGAARDVSERELELTIVRTIDDEIRDLEDDAYHSGLNERDR